MKLAFGGHTVQVISSDAPLGRAVLGKCEGMKCGYRLRSFGRSLRCCGLIERMASSRLVLQQLLTLVGMGA